MKLNVSKSNWGMKLISLFCVCCICLGLIAPTTVCATTTYSTEDGICPTEVKSLIIEQANEGQVKISGSFSDYTFAVVGRLYQVHDDVNSNKIYFVETKPEYSDSIYILNLEFETDAASHNLNIANQMLVGKNVVRVAAYAGGKFYYAEQSYTIEEGISKQIISLSKYSKSPEMQKIISNSAWYSYVKPKTLDYGDSTNSVASYSAYATPLLGDSLDSLDIDVIAKIGRTKFTGERFVYDWNDTGGYLIECVEWPSGSGNILTYCLYYAFVENTPSANDNSAVMEVELVADRQYLYIASENTIEAHFLGTDFRMYDVKLALACAQTSSGKGYDYIYGQTTSLTKNDNTHPAFNVAKAIAMQFDKYGVLSVTDAIFNAFSSDDAVSGTSTFSWPSEYTKHYQSVSHGKRANTMVRAIRIDTDGHLLNEEGAYLHLQAEVMDRDYVNSTSNVAMTKAMIFVFSYNLRSKNAVWSWIGRGDDRGDIIYEASNTYTK